MTGRERVTWRGYWVAAPTPFAAGGALDLDAWAALLELYAGHGVHGILVNGTTGEWFSQSAAERAQLARTAVEVVAGRAPVVVGVTAFTAAEAAALGRDAAEAGADGILATPPPYVHPTDDETVAFYADLAAGCDLPIMVYNWPRGAAVDLSVDVLARLARLDGVVAVKDSTGDELKALQALERIGSQVRFFGRFIHRRGMAAIRELGGDGNIDGGGVGAPFAVPYYEALWAGDLDAARRWSRCYELLGEALVRPDYSARFASPTAQVKAVMRLLGQPGGFVRPPLLELTDPDALAEIRRRLTDVGLVEALAALGQDPRGRSGWTA
jgi:4-hydroxy-tetrahydrodipicolinate synthase